MDKNAERLVKDVGFMVRMWN